MDTLRKIFGIAWMGLGPLAIFYLVNTAIREMEHKPGLDTRIQWITFIIIFIPIAIGLSLFGYYAIKGEYDKE